MLVDTAHLLILGSFLIKSAHYTRENTVTLSSINKISLIRIVLQTLPTIVLIYYVVADSTYFKLQVFPLHPDGCKLFVLSSFSCVFHR